MLCVPGEMACLVSAMAQLDSLRVSEACGRRLPPALDSTCASSAVLQK